MVVACLPFKKMANCFQSGCAALHPWRQCLRDLISPNPHQYFALSQFILSVPVGVQWYLLVVQALFGSGDPKLSWVHAAHSPPSLPFQPSAHTGPRASQGHALLHIAQRPKTTGACLVSWWLRDAFLNTFFLLYTWRWGGPHFLYFQLTRAPSR